MWLFVLKSFVWFCSPRISHRLQRPHQAWRAMTNSILIMFTLQRLDDAFSPADSWQNSAWCNCEMSHAITETILSFRFTIQLRQHDFTHNLAAYLRCLSQRIMFPLLTLCACKRVWPSVWNPIGCVRLVSVTSWSCHSTCRLITHYVRGQPMGSACC